MAIGVPEIEVFQAADRVLARGERPTVERVRAELGRGSPARVGQLLEQWWDRLAKRLAGETRLPELPAEVASAFIAAWAVASEQATATAEQSLAQGRLGVDQEKAALAAERQRWSADLESARADAQVSAEARSAADLRLADHQRLVEQLQIELRDVKAQRNKLHDQVDILARDMMRIASKLEKQEKDHAAERASTAVHVRAVEDRAHAEVDRARAETKVLRAMHLQAERAGQAARDAAAREHKEHVAELRAAERDAAVHRARAAAFEGQLMRLTNVISPPKSRRSKGARITKTRPRRSLSNSQS